MNYCNCSVCKEWRAALAAKEAELEELRQEKQSLAEMHDELIADYEELRGMVLEWVESSDNITVIVQGQQRLRKRFRRAESALSAAVENGERRMK